MKQLDSLNIDNIANLKTKLLTVQGFLALDKNDIKAARDVISEIELQYSTEYVRDFLASSGSETAFNPLATELFAQICYRASKNYPATATKWLDDYTRNVAFYIQWDQNKDLATAVTLRVLELFEYPPQAGMKNQIPV